MTEKAQRHLRIIDSKDAVPQKRKSPASMILEDLSDEYLSVKDVAARYGVHVQTIRRLIKATNDDGTPKVNAPSKAVHQGGLLIYLFTKEDIDEMDAYMGRKGYIAQVEK